MNQPKFIDIQFVRVLKWGVPIGAPMRVTSIGMRVLYTLSGAAALIVGGHVRPVFADYISSTLGVAANWAVLGSGNVTMTGGSIVGSVGVGGGNFTLTGGTIDGAAEVAPGVMVTQTGGSVTGGILTSQSAASAVSAADAASGAFAGLHATQTLGAITGNTTITLTTGLNVIDLSGITMTGQVLTLQGPAGSEVVLNNTGGMTLTSGQIVLAGGLTANDVVFNDTGTGAVTMTGGTLNGTILAPNATVTSGSINGEIIGGEGVTITSGRVVGAPGPTIGAGLPAFAFLGGSFLFARRLRRTMKNDQLTGPASP